MYLTIFTIKRNYKVGDGDWGKKWLSCVYWKWKHDVQYASSLRKKNPLVFSSIDSGWDDREVFQYVDAKT